MLKPVLLLVIPRLEARIEVCERTVRDDASGVVGCDGGAAQALAQDLIAGADALGVEC